MDDDDEARGALGGVHVVEGAVEEVRRTLEEEEMGCWSGVDWEEGSVPRTGVEVRFVSKERLGLLRNCEGLKGRLCMGLTFCGVVSRLSPCSCEGAGERGLDTTFI